MKSSPYLKAFLAVQACALCASAVLHFDPNHVLQQITQAIHGSALRNGRVGRSLQAQATSPKAYAVTYMYSDSDCSEDSMVGALALASNRCIPVEVDVFGISTPSSARLGCADSFYLDVYVGDPTSCSGGIFTVHRDLAENGFVVGKCTSTADGYTKLVCSDGVRSELLNGPGVGFYSSNGTCDSGLVSALFLPQSNCTRISDSSSYRSSCDPTGEFYYEVFNTSATCTGMSTVHEAAADICDDSIDIHVVSEESRQYFAYDITLPTCNASTISSFLAIDDDDFGGGGDDDDDDMASVQLGASLLAIVAAALVALRLTF